jgi:hypothetical protein
VELIDTYIDHFKSTFGGAPSGLYLPSVPVDGQGFSISQNDVKIEMEYIKKGKAAGSDGIMTEQFIYGGDALERIIWILFNYILRFKCIPTQWKEANIVPIYKKKGSEKDIANYRPISLTITMRRLFERCIVRQLGVEKWLNDYQGGFRQKRSTYHQLFILDEIMKNHKKLKCAFLDIKAAYDRVDRRRLWSKLRNNFNMPEAKIVILQKLFDENNSRLLLKSKKSKAIANESGLLQGSSLSPVLFNCYINDLLEELNEKIKTTTHGLHTNVLAFADDLNLHATSMNGLQDLLETCTQWSIRNGLEFAPRKCILLTEGRERALICSEEMANEKIATYLGIKFNTKGIDWKEQATVATAKARKVIGVLTTSGFHINGFSIASNILSYKAFVRPRMEYGLALGKPGKAFMTRMQRTQNTALRMIFSMHNGVSTKAMHKLAQLEPLDARATIMNAKLNVSLHNSLDGANPTVQLWRKGVKKKKIKKRSIIEFGKRNPLFRDAELVNHLEEPLQRHNFRKYNGITKALLEDFKRRSILNMKMTTTNEDGHYNVGESLYLHEKDRVRQILKPEAFESQDQKIATIKWILGGIAMHQQCLNCKTNTLTRKHALECTGFDVKIRMKFNEIDFDSHEKYNVLDIAHNFYRNESRKDLYELTHQIVKKIYTRCLGFKQKKNGFWTKGIG